MSRHHITHHFTAKLRDVCEQACTILMDMILLGIWLVAEYSFEQHLVPKFPVTSPISIVSLWAFRVIFAASTLGPSLLFLYRDIRIIWTRAQATIRHEATVLQLTLPFEARHER
jgi:hypothetical protein